MRAGNPHLMRLPQKTRTNKNMENKLVNSIEVYFETGAKAGKAAKRRDMSLVSFQNRWLSSALNLEASENRMRCREAFNDGYRSESR
jgi:hypothetical protein